MDPAEEALGISVLEKISDTHLCIKLRALPPDTKQKLRETLRQIMANHDEMSRTGGSVKFGLYLVALDDKEAISEQAEIFKSDGLADFNCYLQYSANPAVIIAVGDNLLRENLWQTHDDVDREGIASRTWYVLRRILLSAPEFSDELKAWVESTDAYVASDVPGKPVNPEMMILRQWWRENRAAFQAGNFSKVRSGPALVEQKPIRAQDEDNPRRRPPDSSRVNPPNAVLPAKVSDSGNSFWGALVWIGISSALVIVVCLFFLKRKNKVNLQ